jgi:hypothetical protein
VKNRTRIIFGVIGTVLALLGLTIVSGGNSGAAEVPPVPQVEQDATATAPISTDTVTDAPAPTEGLPSSELPVDYYPTYEPLGDPTVIITGPSCSGGYYGGNLSFMCWVSPANTMGMSVYMGDPYYGGLPSFSGNVTIGDSSVSGHIDTFGARLDYSNVNDPAAATNQACFGMYLPQGNLPVDYMEYIDASGSNVNTYTFTLPDGNVATVKVVDFGNVVKATFALTGVGDFTVTAVEALPASGTFLLGDAGDAPIPCFGMK